jgi:hypothetical protein
MSFTLGEIRENKTLKPFTIDRRNLLFVGKENRGKSETIIRMALDDVYADRKVIFIGQQSDADSFLRFIPKRRQEEVTYFNPTLQPMAINPFWHVPDEKHNVITDAFIDAILSRTGFVAGTTARIENLVTGAVLTLLKKKTESPLSLYYLLVDEKYRESLQESLGPKLWLFWKIFKALSPRDKHTEISSTINKLSKLVYDPILENCFDQEGNYLRVENEITIVSLDRYKLSEASYFLTGALIIANLIGQVSDDSDVTVFIDDADFFGSRVLASLLRQPNINTVLTTSSFHRFQDANEILSHVEVIAFEMSAKDAQILGSDFILNENHYPLNLIPWSVGYVMDQSNYAVIFEVMNHNYKEYSSVKKKVIARCGEHCSQYPPAIEKRLGRFFK